MQMQHRIDVMQLARTGRARIIVVLAAAQKSHRRVKSTSYGGERCGDLAFMPFAYLHRLICPRAQALWEQLHFHERSVEICRWRVGSSGAETERVAPGEE